MNITTPGVQTKTRYSDTELKEFEACILKKIEVAKQDMKYPSEELKKLEGDNTAFDPMHHAEKEVHTRDLARQAKLIERLTAALGRIKNGTYGICAETGTLIPKERLMAVPHTTLCVEAKLKKAA